MSYAAQKLINSKLDRQAVNNLLDELRREKYADILHAQAPRISDYQDYGQYLLDKEYYEDKLIENAEILPPEKQAEAYAILARRLDEIRKQSKKNFWGWVFKIIFFIAFMWWAFHLK